MLFRSIVNVSALDKGTDKKQSITISNSSGVSAEEIEKMVKDAEEHAEEDAKLKEQAELKNRAEQFIHQVDTTLEDEEIDVSDEQKEETQKLRDELQEALDNENYEELKEKLDALEAAAQMMAEQMYAQQDPSVNPEDIHVDEDDDIIDAEFTEKTE